MSPHLLDLVQIRIGDYQLVFVFGALPECLTIGIPEARLSEKLADIPGASVQTRLIVPTKQPG